MPGRAGSLLVLAGHGVADPAGYEWFVDGFGGLAGFAQNPACFVREFGFGGCFGLGFPGIGFAPRNPFMMAMTQRFRDYGQFIKLRLSLLGGLFGRLGLPHCGRSRLFGLGHGLAGSRRILGHRGIERLEPNH